MQGIDNFGHIAGTTDTDGRGNIDHDNKQILYRPAWWLESGPRKDECSGLLCLFPEASEGLPLHMPCTITNKPNFFSKYNAI
jgi:hypothetical protein